MKPSLPGLDIMAGGNTIIALPPVDTYSNDDGGENTTTKQQQTLQDAEEVFALPLVGNKRPRLSTGGLNIAAAKQGVQFQN